MNHELIAAIDLGSNSFRLQVGRIVNDQIYPLDGIKESVRLAAGLSPDRMLDAAAQFRGLNALRCFNERIRDYPPEAVRAVATNTLRVAKNAPHFLIQAEAALGFPIEVIAGREEARLIYVGVAHTLPNPHRQQLVVDIGGGSTEFIIGKSFKPLELESLYMGCVGYSLRYFPDGRVDKKGLREAELAALKEIQTISHAYRRTGWEEAVGSSGSAKALVEILELNGLSAGGITRDGLEKLKVLMLKAGSVQALQLEGLRPDRLPVLPGGFAIMSAIFQEFGLERMVFSEGALRLGVLYDLLGRYHHHDLRDATVTAFMERYSVDVAHARRVADTALHFLEQLDPSTEDPENTDRRFVEWAALLHEVGVSVAHSSYHKHSAYILGNADMPGFSRMDQGRLSRMVLAHRGKLARVSALDPESLEWRFILCLRLAAVVHRARDGRGVPPLRVKREGRAYVLLADGDWLRNLPLTAAALDEEERQWQGIGMPLRVRVERAARGAA
ncbi:MAG TPA: exopolyphosphatase [Zoogloea sp.]|uniref:exopolyphosphatase n=1 Tax=Zoogloea sp. TaxID=49181 RepID=UPI002C2CE666|nr:exopolyphosphatase [Zoogloea sp.]HMV18216.1 exopolyphosphatase [Rhodocyclaceae bacterium]HMV63898.1 exopolyphosphatase [Rhodocyclaceae bacterium]HMW52812.1 exopolyphosphatase [Rhodocyclaceae bacterium]HMY48936.1 exopolyphosphatase [Rhodocyclaceae bacterium]HMZ75739.1 exopolyphosphatase [Rhodocyclaceae bacterium]